MEAKTAGGHMKISRELWRDTEKMGAALYQSPPAQVLANKFQKDIGLEKESQRYFFVVPRTPVED